MIEAVHVVQSASALRPAIAVVLGSGLSAFADSLTDTARLPYATIPGFPASTAIGHKGELVIGLLGSKPLIVMSGRFHLYEGYSAHQAATGIRLFRALGVRTVVLTNAAGGINLKYGQGALVAISDHINLQSDNPLIGPNDNALGPRFPDLTEAYSVRLRQLAHQIAAAENITLHEGIYAALAGPSYETPAEIRFLRTIGADLVGMSTAAETIAARHMGLEVLGISCVTNLAAGMSGEPVNHEEVLEIGRRVSGTFVRLLGALLPKMG